jgi:hypothetical protein
VDKKAILKELSIGARIAEEESAELAGYFVETDQWRRILAGEVDVIYGPKGSGKSAIYSLLISRENALFDRHILVVAAENPRGTPAFRDLVIDPPASEEEFRNLWKLYLLALIGTALREYDVKNKPAANLYETLETAGFLQKRASLQSLVRDALAYVRSVAKAESIQGGLEIDPLTGLVKGVNGKITFRTPSASEAKAGLQSADQLLELSNAALEEAEISVWVLLDRLDVAFAESEDLEKNALRALFRVYLDTRALKSIQFKIFLRTDLWRRITQEGWREASHITRDVTINWNSELLLNLLVRRLLSNTIVRSAFDVDEQTTLKDTDRQSEFFYRLFAKQVDSGSRKPTTLDWMLSRTRDGTGETAPRELIHLLTEARAIQLRQVEAGQEVPAGETLIGPAALREALTPVSDSRLSQTLYAEYPSLRPWIEKIEGQKTQHTRETLAEVWKVSVGEASDVATKLVDVGFFEKRGTREQPVYWVPFIYRPALKLVQGSADKEVFGVQDAEELTDST